MRVEAICYSNVEVKILNGKIQKISITVPGFDKDGDVKIFEGDIVITNGLTNGCPGIRSIVIDSLIPKEE